MFGDYIKIAWRNLKKNKAFSFINIFGLSIGLTSFLLIALYVFDELTFDSFHKNADHIYRVVAKRTDAEGKETKYSGAGYQLSEKGKTVLPQIKDAARIISLQRINVKAAENDNTFYESYTLANQGFLSTFDFKLLSGDRNTALSAPHSVIVTEQTAKKFFNSTDVVGKALKLDGDSLPFKITAVLQDFPVNSHLSFNLLFSESSINNEDFKKFTSSDWNSGAFATYLSLNGSASAAAVQSRINALVKDNSEQTNKDKIVYTLQPLKQIHFYSNDIEGDSGKKGNIAYIYVFCIVAVFVLLIACINYMNLTTARFANRAKEIAVRKVAGASRKVLVKQFLSEAILVTGIAFVFSLLFVELLLPYFNDFTEKELSLDLSTDYRIWIGIILIVVIVGLLSGLYPSLFQSRSNPLQLLKSKINFGRGNISVRRALVVFQFALSIIMIIATIVVYLQMKYVNTKDMGFNKEQLAVIDINSGKIRRNAETIKTELSKLTQVKSVSVSTRVPGEWKDLPKVKVKNEKIASSEGADMYFIGADDQFLKTYQINLVQGRNFTNAGLADSSAVLLNETAAKQLGITDPQEQIIELPLDGQSFRARVVGIVKDFNFQSLREPLASMVVCFQKNPIQNIDYFTVRLASNNIAGTLDQMNAILRSIDESHLFEYHFLDKQWDLFYQEDQIRQTIFFLIAILTILVACLGLFGLATYAAEQRIKEIGIRKVLGASVQSIVAMLSKDFLKLVFIASLIAFPLAWLAMNRWLSEFSFRITISWWVFIVAGCVAIFIALFTISFRAIRAAVANPVKSLRTE